MILENQKMDLAKRRFEIMNLTWYLSEDEKLEQKAKAEREELERIELEKKRLEWLVKERKLYESLSKVSSVSVSSSSGRLSSSVGLKTLTLVVNGTLSSFLNDAGIFTSVGDVESWNTFFDLPVHGSRFSSVNIVSDGGTGTIELFNSGVIELKNNLFQNNMNIVQVIDEGMIISVRLYCFSSSGLQIFTSPTTTIFGDYSFEGVTLLDLSLSVVREIGEYCFSGSNLSAVGQLDFNQLDSIGGYCFKDSIISEVGELGFVSILPIQCFSGSSITKIGGDTVALIGAECFYGCSNLDTITLNSVYEIDTDAFRDCSALDNIILNAAKIGSGVFRGCSNLSVIYLPQATEIGDNCFNQCVSMSELYMYNCLSIGTTNGNDSVFGGITGNTIQLAIPPSVVSDGDIVSLQSRNFVTII
jgi:hypothetical protein